MSGGYRDRLSCEHHRLLRPPASLPGHLYPGAGHAFACDARPAMYDTEAATLAWDRTYAFLAEHLPPGHNR
ncbi:hypothetical protein GCM10010530_18040 [Kribbella aluminosa]